MTACATPSTRSGGPAEQHDGGGTAQAGAGVSGRQRERMDGRSIRRLVRAAYSASFPYLLILLGGILVAWWLIILFFS